MGADYDIQEAFQKIENEMIQSMINNMKHHLEVEKAEGLNYAQWQALELQGLEEYRKRNQKLFKGYFARTNKKIEAALKQCYRNGNMEAEIKILEALKKGYKIPNRTKKGTTTAEFFKINDRKLQALIDSTMVDFQKAEMAMLRRQEDEYRKIIYNSQVYYNTGTGTLEQAVDMATHDFLASGLNCIEYKNGVRVAIDVYAKMALRTASTRAYLQGESAKRDEWGINTVIVNKRGVACPMCLQWVGRVYYDDVWGNLPVTDTKYPKLSEAVAGGLYHPNCKDSHTTYFEGITTKPEPMTKAQKQEAQRVYDLEQKQRYYERNIRKYKRLRDGSVDGTNKRVYSARVRKWQDNLGAFLAENNSVLKRRIENEKIHNVVKFTEPPKYEAVGKNTANYKENGKEKTLHFHN